MGPWFYRRNQESPQDCGQDQNRDEACYRQSGNRQSFNNYIGGPVRFGGVHTRIDHEWLLRCLLRLTTLLVQCIAYAWDP
jgi:hypothetical protein